METGIRDAIRSQELLDADFFARDPRAKALFNLGLRSEILADRDSNIFQRLFTRRSLTVATGKIIAPNGKAFLRFHQRHVIIHPSKMLHWKIFSRPFYLSG